MILAQYSIRSKQDYIFKTSRVLEIVGASENIANIWDKLFEVALEANIPYQRARDCVFNMDDTRKAFENRTLSLVELFCGGGNETVLFDTEETMKTLNRKFSYNLLTDYPGMVPMVVFVETTGNYSEDYRRLMAESERKKNTMEPLWDIFTVPFAMMDRGTFQPYSHSKKINGQVVRMSDESLRKYEVGQAVRDKNEEIRLFDDMVTRKGMESLLAVVHADGNNMGKKIMGMLQGESDYGNAVEKMRIFTETTAECFETEGDEALKKCHDELQKKYEDLIKEKKMNESSLAYRRVIGSGDDVTFICNARFVMEYVKAYLTSVQNFGKSHDSEWNYSSCAGICIFHSHYPFSRAYAIAEQACDDSAKKKVHSSEGNDGKKVIEQGWVDFHFIHKGISGDLEEIRRSQGTVDCMARPWLVTYDVDDQNAKPNDCCFEKLQKLKEIFEKKRGNNHSAVSRTAIKTIGSAMERSMMAAKKELISLYGHTPGLKKDIEEVCPDERVFLKAFYDFAELYDLWYTGVK